VVVQTSPNCLGVKMASAISAKRFGKGTSFWKHGESHTKENEDSQL
jgi:hypothetical protein